MTSMELAGTPAVASYDSLVGCRARLRMPSALFQSQGPDSADALNERHRVSIATVSLVYLLADFPACSRGKASKLTFLAPSMLEPPISGAAAAHYLDQSARHRPTKLPMPIDDNKLPRQIPHLINGQIPRSSRSRRRSSADEAVSTEGSDSETSEAGSAESSTDRRSSSGSQENFLGRVQSYQKLIHAHTKSQMRSPTSGTLPSYTRTMYVHTLNQLNVHKNAAISAMASADDGLARGVAGRHMMLPHKICAALDQLGRDEVPAGPSNSPEQTSEGIARLKASLQHRRQRSLTEPVPRDFATTGTVQTRDFGMPV
ncbi:hypothetical protein Tdes44962_MAKER01353 [Teratosphaeria destructans]|uniref:Uncharacterized protein n=1 Tax=Teratosphaeria destructans TaxID=418781 RepID=A0A9W7W6N0_9PEZI|nr:hypothetical protein Tdes44962_MAKER01353 [Teratosphaeria destructans]